MLGLVFSRYVSIYINLIKLCVWHYAKENEYTYNVVLSHLLVVIMLRADNFAEIPTVKSILHTHIT